MSYSLLNKSYDETYENITELQEYRLLKCIEVGKEHDEFRPYQVGMELGFPKDRASSPVTVSLRKGIAMGIFEIVKFGVYRYTGKEYVPKYEENKGVI